jgi:WD40 repeat protein
MDREYLLKKPGGITSVAISPDNSKIAVSFVFVELYGYPWEGFTCIYDLQTGSLIQEISYSQEVHCAYDFLSFSPDGQHLAGYGVWEESDNPGGMTTTYTTLDIYNTQTWEKEESYESKYGQISAMEFSPQGTYIMLTSYLGNDNITLFNILSKTEEVFAHDFTHDNAQMTNDEQYLIYSNKIVDIGTKEVYDVENYIPASSYCIYNEYNELLLAATWRIPKNYRMLKLNINDIISAVTESKINNLELHPNPGSNFVSVPVNYTTQKIQITALDGKTIQTVDVKSSNNENTFSLNISEFKPGLYFVNVYYSRNVKTYKLIKE